MGIPRSVARVGVGRIDEEGSDPAVAPLEVHPGFGSAYLPARYASHWARMRVIWPPENRYMQESSV